MQSLKDKPLIAAVGPDDGEASPIQGRPPIALSPSADAAEPLRRRLEHDPEVVRSIVEDVLRTVGVTAYTPFTDFPGLVHHLPMFKERTLRDLVKGRIIPSVRVPRTRKLGFHLPSVNQAVLAYQEGVAR